MSQTILVALVVPSLLAGVSGDANPVYEMAFRASYRLHTIARCEQNILSESPGDANAHDFCVCVTDKILASSTLAQLSHETPESLSKKFAEDCFTEHPSPGLMPMIWRTARAQMRMSQVQALFPLAHAPDHPKQLAGLREGLVFNDQLEGKPAEVGFFFSGDALAIVSIGSRGPQVDRAYVERIVAGLKAKYGAPSDAVDERAPAAGPGWTQSSRKWVAGPTQITVLATPSLKPINVGRERSEHAVIVFYSPGPAN